ncbi:MAG: endopeptidase La [Muribaculaceae bacterium]|nr:endopeptidase La [Muribaculaceae bacterium]
MEDNDKNSEYPGTVPNLEESPQLGGMVGDVKEDFRFDDFDFNDKSMPAVALRDLVPFPFLFIPLPVKDENTLTVLRAAQEKKQAVLLTVVKDTAVETVAPDDLHDIGVVAVVSRLVQMPDGTHTALIATCNRGRKGRVTRRKPFLRLHVSPAKDIFPEKEDGKLSTPFAILMQSVLEKYRSFLDMLGEEQGRELKFTISQFDDAFRAISFICMTFPMGRDERYELLAESEVEKRMSRLLHHIDRTMQLVEIRQELNRKVHEELTASQREQFLQVQLRAIREELGENLTESDDEAALLERADKMVWSAEARKHFDKELEKLRRFNVQQPDYAVQYTYLDNFLNLPWDKVSEENFDLHKVQEVLDRDHFGMEKVKERIIEHIAVLKLRKDMKAPIICLYGPPGVGKTSLGRSIAEALGREYCRVSLGGVHDEAEIRGHRRTYIGAMPGRIMSGLLKSGTANPVFVLDEIDKIGKDMKGDPSTALLEVLDPEQNSKFHDNYVDFDYDLSKILFIATANSLSTISAPLLDRMEVIEIGGYVAEEKVNIALGHLWPRVLADHGFEKDDVTLTPEGVRCVIDLYTRESGVRRLEKKLASIARKLARSRAMDEDYPKQITPEEVKKYLGKQEVYPEVYDSNDYAGVVTGLAWTSVGGEILFIESSLSSGKEGKLTLTGNLGDVMKESAVIALQYLKAHASRFGIDPEAFAKNEVHIHVPEGAVPKDGPSAGITITTSLTSALTGRRVRDKIAMTGEITLRGKVLPVGGIREKILAARRAGITEIILSTKNRRDVEEIPAAYLEGLSFRYVDRVEEVLDYALLSEQAPHQ